MTLPWIAARCHLRGPYRASVRTWPQNDASYLIPARDEETKLNSFRLMKQLSWRSLSDRCTEYACGPEDSFTAQSTSLIQGYSAPELGASGHGGELG